MTQPTSRLGRFEDKLDDINLKLDRALPALAVLDERTKTHKENISSIHKYLGIMAVAVLGLTATAATPAKEIVFKTATNMAKSVGAINE